MGVRVGARMRVDGKEGMLEVTSIVERSTDSNYIYACLNYTASTNTYVHTHTHSYAD